MTGVQTCALPICNDDLGIVTPNSNDDVNKGYGTSKVNEGQDRY